MAKLLNQKAVATHQASVGKQEQGAFTYKGFCSAETTKNFKKYDIDLVKQDLINHFHIRKGEKLENPSFGTIIWDVLFDQFTDEVRTLIAKDVEQIINYDPRVIVQSLAIDTTAQGIRIEASVLYMPFNVVETMTFNFDKTNGIVN